MFYLLIYDNNTYSLVFPCKLKKYFGEWDVTKAYTKATWQKVGSQKGIFWTCFLKIRHFFGLKNPTLQRVGHKVYHRRILQPRNQVLDGSQDLLMQQQVGCVIWIEWYHIPGGRGGFLGFGGWWVWKGINY